MLAQNETAYSGQSFQAAFNEDVEGCGEHYPEWKNTSKNDIHENEHEREFDRDESELGTGRCVCPAPLSSSACHLFPYLTSSRVTKLDGRTRLSTHLSKRSGGDSRNGIAVACARLRFAQAAREGRPSRRTSCAAQGVGWGGRERAVRKRACGNTPKKDRETY